MTQNSKTSEDVARFGTLRRALEDDGIFSATDVALMLGTQEPAAPHPGQGLAAHLVTWAISAIGEISARHRLRRELEALAGDELDRVLADAGLSRGDVEAMLANYPTSERLLGEMAQRLGIADRLEKHRLTERDMLRLCTVCKEQGRCKHWLASGATEGYEDFCPNADALATMQRAEQWARTPQPPLKASD